MLMEISHSEKHISDNLFKTLTAERVSLTFDICNYSAKCACGGVLGALS